MKDSQRFIIGRRLRQSVRDMLQCLGPWTRVVDLRLVVGLQFMSQPHPLHRLHPLRPPAVGVGPGSSPNRPPGPPMPIAPWLPWLRLLWDWCRWLPPSP